jgi:hypothetical protein
LALNVGAPAVLEHIPVGTVLIEVYRNGAWLKSERIEIKTAQTDLTVRLPTPFDWSGQWEVEYQPQPNDPWFKIGVMTWRKATMQEALDLKAKQLGTSADPCLGRTSYAAFIADFPWGPAGFEGGKMAGFACGPDARNLEGRYGHTKHFGSFLGGLKGYIQMTLDADSRGFHGSFVEDFATGSWLEWRGKRLGS